MQPTEAGIFRDGECRRAAWRDGRCLARERSGAELGALLACAVRACAFNRWTGGERHEGGTSKAARVDRRISVLLAGAFALALYSHYLSGPIRLDSEWVSEENLEALAGGWRELAESGRYVPWSVGSDFLRASTRWPIFRRTRRRASRRTCSSSSSWRRTGRGRSTRCSRTEGRRRMPGTGGEPVERDAWPGDVRGVHFAHHRVQRPLRDLQHVLGDRRHCPRVSRPAARSAGNRRGGMID